MDYGLSLNLSVYAVSGVSGFQRQKGMYCMLDDESVFEATRPKPVLVKPRCLWSPTAKSCQLKGESFLIDFRVICFDLT